MVHSCFFLSLCRIIHSLHSPRQSRLVVIDDNNGCIAVLLALFVFLFLGGVQVWGLFDAIINNDDVVHPFCSHTGIAIRAHRSCSQADNA